MVLMKKVKKTKMTIFKELKDLVTIEDYVGKTLGEYTGKAMICPFHEDEHPSFSVSKDLQIFKCFACGETGDVISFAEKYHHLTPMAAARKIIEEYSLDINIKDDPNQEYFTSINKRLKEVQGTITEEHFRYLATRGIDSQTINELGIGGSPGYVHLPVRDENGRVVTLNSRLMLDIPNKPKYIIGNTTPIFSKSKVLPGLHESKKFTSNTVIITEGQLDQIACYQAGYAAVACLTNRLSVDQCDLLLQRYSKIVTAYDNDEAGIKGQIEAYKLLKSRDAHVTIKVANLNGCNDYNEYFLSNKGKIETCPIYEWAAEVLMDEGEILDLLAVEPSHIEIRRAANWLANNDVFEKHITPDDIFHDILMRRQKKVTKQYK